MKETSTKNNDLPKEEVAITDNSPNATEEEDSKVEEAESKTEKKSDSE